MLEIRWSILVVIVYHKSPQNLFWCCHTQNERITVASLYNWLGQLNESTSLEKTLFAHVTLRQFLHSDRPTSLVSWSSETNKVRTFYSLIIVHRHEYRFQMWLASNPCSSSCTHISVNNLCTDCTSRIIYYWFFLITYRFALFSKPARILKMCEWSNSDPRFRNV